jgi:hypothetical protein
MKFSTNCSGECSNCYIHYTGACIAGHGDDDFIKITQNQAKELIEGGKLSDHNIVFLKEKFPELNKKLICVLCGREWLPAIKNRCECGGFCSWGYKLNKPESFSVDKDNKWHLNPPPQQGENK